MLLISAQAIGIGLCSHLPPAKIPVTQSLESQFHLPFLNNGFPQIISALVRIREPHTGADGSYGGIGSGGIARPVASFGLIEHVTLTRSVSEAVKGNYGFSWAEKQEIKNELFGEDRFAIEVYPKERKLVDSADVYHLWVFDKKKEMPFGIHPKEYTKAVNRGYSMTEDELKVLKAYYDGK